MRTATEFNIKIKVNIQHQNQGQRRRTSLPLSEVEGSVRPIPVVLYNSFVPLLRNLRVTLEMIKWEHSIFALPFALCGAMLAANGLPGGQQLLWIIVAMVSARSAAMAFNRLA